MDGLGKAVGSGLGGIGSSIGGLFDSFGRAVSGLVGGAVSAVASTGPAVLIGATVLVLVVAVFLWRSVR